MQITEQGKLDLASVLVTQSRQLFSKLFWLPTNGRWLTLQMPGWVTGQLKKCVLGWPCRAAFVAHVTMHDHRLRQGVCMLVCFESTSAVSAGLVAKCFQPELWLASVCRVLCVCVRARVGLLCSSCAMRFPLCVCVCVCVYVCVHARVLCAAMSFMHCELGATPWRGCACVVSKAAVKDVRVGGPSSLWPRKGTGKGTSL